MAQCPKCSRGMRWQVHDETHRCGAYATEYLDSEIRAFDRRGTIFPVAGTPHWVPQDQRQPRWKHWVMAYVRELAKVLPVVVAFECGIAYEVGGVWVKAGAFVVLAVMMLAVHRKEAK